jgi:hypothetical protein
MMGYGAAGASALIHPVDPYSFGFNTTNTLGYPTLGTQFLTGCPATVGIGFPLAITVIVEVMVHVEAITGTITNGQLITNPDVRAGDTTLADYFPSIETMYRTIASYIPTAASVERAASTLASVNSMARRLYGRRDTPQRQYGALPVNRYLRLGDVD